MSATAVGEVVNLRRERKRRARAAGEASAAASRMAHGIARPETLRARAEAALAERRLAGHRRDSDDPPDDA